MAQIVVLEVIVVSFFFFFSSFLFLTFVRSEIVRFSTVFIIGLVCYYSKYSKAQLRIQIKPLILPPNDYMQYCKLPSTKEMTR